MSDALATPKPLELYATLVKPEWVDHNGHMNLAYYPMAFYEATNALSLHLGMTREFKNRTKTASFAANLHLSYRREVRDGDPLRFLSRIINFDSKRVHFWHEMHHATDDYLAATCEMMSLNIDTTLRRVADMPAELLERLREIHDVHALLPPPAGLGHSIKIDDP